MVNFLLLGISSLLLVGLGQPGWIPHLAPLAAAFGYALFWRAFLVFPSKKKRFLAAAVWFALVQSIQLSWMTSYEFQGIYILFVYAFLMCALGVQFGLLSLLIPGNAELRLPRVLMLASVWTLFEWVRYLVLCGFTFNPTGLALGANLLSIQFAAIWGVLGLSFWVMLTNGFALKLFLSKKGAFSWLVIALIPYLFGWGHLKMHQNPCQRAPTLDVALVQTGLLPSQKVPLSGKIDSFIHPFEQWQRIFSLLKKTQKDRFDIIVLPEAALPFLVDQPVYPLAGVEQLARNEFGEYALPPLNPALVATGSEGISVSNAYIVQFLSNHFRSEVVAGFDGYDPKNKKYFNAAFHFLPNGATPERYDKRMLMPVAEYLPYRWTEKLAASYGITDFFEPGREAKVFRGKVPFSISICYDETFPHLVREGRVNGSNLFITVTNDNWYPESRLPKQHFDLGRLRTVENGVPLLRAGNSGITGGVDSLGRIITKIGEGGSSDWASGIATGQISTYHYRTPYLFWGNSGILFLSFFMIALFLFLEKRRVKKATSHKVEVNYFGARPKS